MRYFHRAEERVLQIRPGEALDWLASRDEADRAAWVELFSSSELTLGKVMQRHFIERESLWLVDSKAKRARDEPQGGSSKRAAVDGREICSGWNRGACNRNEDDCGKLHMCSRECKGGRACGIRNHRAGKGENIKRVH